MLYDESWACPDMVYCNMGLVLLLLPRENVDVGFRNVNSAMLVGAENHERYTGEIEEENLSQCLVAKTQEVLTEYRAQNDGAQDLSNDSEVLLTNEVGTEVKYYLSHFKKSRHFHADRHTGQWRCGIASSSINCQWADVLTRVKMALSPPTWSRAQLLIAGSAKSSPRPEIVGWFVEPVYKG